MQRTHLLYLSHIDPSLVARYTAALATVPDGHEVEVVLVNHFVPGLLSQAYVWLANELRDEDGRILPALARRFPAKLPLVAYDTISIASFSAGYALWRNVLASPADADAISMLVGIDSWHTSFDPDGTPSDAGLAQLVAYAVRARDTPRVLWLGHSDVPTPQPPHRDAYASTTQVARELVRLVGGQAGGFRVRAYDVETDAAKEHLAAARSWGPAWLREAYGELLERRKVATAESAEPLPSTSADAKAGRQLGSLAVNVSLSERAADVHRVPGPESHARILEYFNGCERDGKPLTLRTDDEPYCAAAATWATFRALRTVLGQDDSVSDKQLLALATARGILVPHRRRVSVREVWADLMSSSSAVSAAAVRRQVVVPRAGDLWVMTRGEPAGAESAPFARSHGLGHIERVMTFTNNVATCIGANVDGRWRVTTRRADDPAFVGVGLMPRIAAPAGPVVPGDAEAEALRLLCSEDLGG